MYITASTNLSDMTEEFNQSESKILKKTISICFGCGTQINDQYILRVAPDLEWHAKCLKCVECGQYLDENCTCFVRNGKTYCKLDYVRLFSKKCFKCKEGFSKTDFVMRANNHIYHIDCFRCNMCNKQLTPGDEFALKEDGLLCKMDNEMYEKHLLATGSSILQQQSLSAMNSMQPLQAPMMTSTSCQNITNLPPNMNQMNPSMGNPKGLLKCEDLLNPAANDYEDNQNNCLSPTTSNLTNHNLHPHLNHLGQAQPRMSHLIHPHSHAAISQNGHLQAGNGGLQPPSRLLNSSAGAGNGNMNTSSASSTSSTSSTASSVGSNSGGSTGGGGTNGVIHHHGGHGGGHGGHGHHRKDKTTRVRTVLNEKQLHTLRTCYGANPRPDALMKEQLVEMTGLSPRVIRVWFQNKRCKDKKKTILIKQMQEQQKNRQSIGHGMQMVASSPVRNDINNLGPPNQVEIQQSSAAYQTSNMPWKTLSDYNGMNGMNGNGGGAEMGGASGSYDQLMSFASDEEDCFDPLSDQGGDDSGDGSVGLEDSRIQQL